MPVFDTPAPVSVTAQVDAGSVRFTAGERRDTVVEVAPRDPEREQDVRAAGQTEVAYAGGVLTVRAPRQRNLLGRGGTVDVTVGLPTGSHVEVTGSWTQVLGEGRLGEVRVRTSTGDVRLDTTGPLQLTASHGAVTVDRAEGLAEITTSSGSVRVGVLAGPAVLRNTHGATSVGTAQGDLRVSGAHGDVDVAHAESSVTATTAHGALRVGDVARGSVQLETSYGSVEIGVREGTAAWIDADSGHGQVRHTLAPTGAPAATGSLVKSAGGAGPEETVKVRVRTRYGNVDVRRARP
jgi:Putative adhesin